MTGLGDAPLGVIPKASDHGDVHAFLVMRSNGDSLTVREYERVFAAVTGHPIGPGEVETVREWFAQEDR